MIYFMVIIIAVLLVFILLVFEKNAKLEDRVIDLEFEIDRIDSYLLNFNERLNEI